MTTISLAGWLAAIVGILSAVAALATAYPSLDQYSERNRYRVERYGAAVEGDEERSTGGEVTKGPRGREEAWNRVYVRTTKLPAEPSDDEEPADKQIHGAVISSPTAIATTILRTNSLGRDPVSGSRELEFAILTDNGKENISPTVLSRINASVKRYDDDLAARYIVEPDSELLINEKTKTKTKINNEKPASDKNTKEIIDKERYRELEHGCEESNPRKRSSISLNSDESADVKGAKSNDEQNVMTLEELLKLWGVDTSNAAKPTVRTQRGDIEIRAEVGNSDSTNRGDLPASILYADARKRRKRETAASGRKLLWSDDDNGRRRPGMWGFAEDEGLLVSDRASNEDDYDDRQQHTKRVNNHHRKHHRYENDADADNETRRNQERRRIEEEKRRQWEEQERRRIAGEQQRRRMEEEEQRRRTAEEQKRRTPQQEEEEGKEEEEQLRRLEEERRKRPFLDEQRRKMEDEHRRRLAAEQQRKRFEEERLRRPEAERRRRPDDEERRRMEEEHRKRLAAEEQRKRHEVEQQRRRTEEEEQLRRLEEERRRRPDEERRRQPDEDRRFEEEQRRRIAEERRRIEEEQRRRNEPSRQEDTKKTKNVTNDSYEERMRQWQRMKEEHDRLLRERENNRNQANGRKSQEDLEMERKLQDYIRRNTPIVVGNRAGHNRYSTPANLTMPEQRKPQESANDKRVTLGGEEDEERLKEQRKRIPEDGKKHRGPYRGQYEEEMSRREKEFRKRLQEENRVRETARNEPGRNEEPSRNRRPDEDDRSREDEQARRTEHERRLQDEQRRKMVEEQRRRYEEERRKYQAQHGIPGVKGFENSRPDENPPRLADPRRPAEGETKTPGRAYQPNEHRRPTSGPEAYERNRQENRWGGPTPVETGAESRRREQEAEERRREEEGRSRERTEDNGRKGEWPGPRQDAPRESQEGGLLEQRRREEANRRYWEMKKKEDETSRARAAEPSDDKQWQERVKMLPVSASIIIRSTDPVYGNVSRPTLSMRQGGAVEIDFPGFSPSRKGPEAHRFPSAPTPRPPAPSPPSCVWAIVVCCRNPKNVEVRTRCFEAADCLSWDDGNNSCAMEKVKAANNEIRRFYLWNYPSKDTIILS